MAPDMKDGKEPPQPLTLLGLPPHIRRRIYLRAGVARFDGYPYTYYLDGRKPPRTGVSNFDPPPARNFTGLLLSCRTLYAETAALLYSANRFVIFYSHHGSLSPLHALSPATIASLISLKIVLNQSSCHHPIDSYNYPPPCCCTDGRCRHGFYCTSRFHRDVHNRPLLDPALDSDSASSTEVATQLMLREWHETATYLSSSVGTERLVLSLVCDINPEHPDALSLGRLAVAPLALFPPLKNCHVRLAKKWKHPLQQLAEEAVLQARRASSVYIPSPRPAATLTTLPRELRQRILQYTDLITPWKEVTVSRQHRGYQLCRPPCTNEFGCPERVHAGCRLVECHSDVDGPHEGSQQLPGCFCRRRHTAFSSSCCCWVPPTALFLVCRVLCRDAQFVFFSGNRFVVYDFDALMPWYLPDVEHYPYDRLFAAEFLRDMIPAHCLADLRFLELVFPPYGPDDWPGSESAAVLDWSRTVGWIRGKVNAPALTVSVVMADYRYSPGDVREALTKEQGMQIINGYSAVLYFLRPLARDDGLGGIHIQVAYPWRWTPGNMRRHSGGLEREEQHLSKYAEGFVLQGESPCERSKPSKEHLAALVRGRQQLQLEVLSRRGQAG